MPGARWFPGATLNYTHHALRNLTDDDVAIIALDETGSGYELTGNRLRAQVASLAATLRDLGVGRGDRVVGYLPNTPHTIVAFLATASLGAVWSVCGQDYAPRAAADRFAQLEPTVLIAADGYLFNGTTHDRRDATRELAQALPTSKATLLADHVGLPWPDTTHPSLTIPWEDATTRTEELVCTPVPFDHPLWVVFSSGTTGLPKGIVHGHGGVLLEHLKTLTLHSDLGPGDRLLWYTTTHWMMWNLVASTLLTGATTCTYDGSPAPLSRPDILWDLAARQRVTVFGTSPQYLLGMAKSGIDPSPHDLSSVRVIGCTGSTLPASAYPWVRDHVGADVLLASISGGTDVVSAFAGSTPTTPVWAGELSAPHLGVALSAYDEEGLPVTAQVGELVITRPLPSMPLHFWNDPDGTRYHDAYFSSYPGVWRHGDWITLTPHGSVIVHGRSDSTLNRNGVRLGSADIHDAVERLPEIAEALVIGAEEPDGGYWMPLFVVPTAGVSLDDPLREKIRTAIRTDASPRHVPDEILQVPAIPHTAPARSWRSPSNASSRARLRSRSSIGHRWMRRNSSTTSLDWGRNAAAGEAVTPVRSVRLGSGLQPGDGVQHRLLGGTCPPHGGDLGTQRLQDACGVPVAPVSQAVEPRRGEVDEGGRPADGARHLQGPARPDLDDADAGEVVAVPERAVGQMDHDHDVAVFTMGERSYRSVVGDTAVPEEPPVHPPCGQDDRECGTGQHGRLTLLRRQRVDVQPFRACAGSGAEDVEGPAPVVRYAEFLQRGKAETHNGVPPSRRPGSTWVATIPSRYEGRRTRPVNRGSSFPSCSQVVSSTGTPRTSATAPLPPGAALYAATSSQIARRATAPCCRFPAQASTAPFSAPMLVPATASMCTPADARHSTTPT